jgi:hypothetical protein
VRWQVTVPRASGSHDSDLQWETISAQSLLTQSHYEDDEGQTAQPTTPFPAHVKGRQ